MYGLIHVRTEPPAERMVHAKPPSKTGMDCLPSEHDTSKMQILVIM